MTLDEHDVEPAFGKSARADLARRPRTDHDDVGVAHTPTLVANVPAVDVTDETFEREVVERSAEVPVIVDFWAEWCNPCKLVTPVLERAVAAYDGTMILAKLDVGANPNAAERYRVRGLPSVKAFRNGSVVAELAGVQRPSVVARFLEGLQP